MSAVRSGGPLKRYASSGVVGTHSICRQSGGTVANHCTESTFAISWLTNGRVISPHSTALSDSHRCNHSPKRAGRCSERNPMSPGNESFRISALLTFTTQSPLPAPLHYAPINPRLSPPHKPRFPEHQRQRPLNPRRPEKPNRPRRPCQFSFANQLLQRPRPLQNRHAPAGVVVRPPPLMIQVAAKRDLL